jgi:hypothetical protein
MSHNWAGTSVFSASTCKNIRGQNHSITRCLVISHSTASVDLISFNRTFTIWGYSTAINTTWKCVWSNSFPCEFSAFAKWKLWGCWSWITITWTCSSSSTPWDATAICNSSQRSSATCWYWSRTCITETSCRWFLNKSACRSRIELHSIKFSSPGNGIGIKLTSNSPSTLTATRFSCHGSPTSIDPESGRGIRNLARWSSDRCR